MASWRDVRTCALAMPGASEERSYNAHAAWVVDKKNFVWERPLRRADFEALGDAAPRGTILGVRTEDLEMKEALLAANPRVFFTTPHFDGYPAVLVRLDKISTARLKDIVVDAWLARASKRAVKEYLATTAARPRRRKRAAHRSRA